MRDRETDRRKDVTRGTQLFDERVYQERDKKEWEEEEDSEDERRNKAEKMMKKHT
jgi:hypothetical protein